MAIYSGFFFGFLFFFSLLLLLLYFFFFPSSCKIGVWLNTCKLCCDYQPLKSSLKINLYIVKFPRLIILYLLSELFKCSGGKFIFKYADVISKHSDFQFYDINLHFGVFLSVDQFVQFYFLGLFSGAWGSHGKKACELEGDQNQGLLFLIIWTQDRN